MTPHIGTDWEHTAALLKRSWGLLLWVQDEYESARRTTIMDPNSSQQQREEQGSKEKLQLGRFKLASDLFPRGQAVQQWNRLPREMVAVLWGSPHWGRQSQSWHDLVLSIALLWQGGWTKYATEVPYTPQVCYSNLQEPFAGILPYLNKIFSFSKVLYISQEKSIFTSNLSTVRRDFLMQVQSTSAKTRLANYFKYSYWEKCLQISALK